MKHARVSAGSVSSGISCHEAICLRVGIAEGEGVGEEVFTDLIGGILLDDRGVSFPPSVEFCEIWKFGIHRGLV